MPLLEVLDAAHDELHHRLVAAGRDGKNGAARECLHLILADAADQRRAGALDAVARVRQGRL